jgi:myo-inositol-1(or 4)-monophosphatase
MVDPLDGTTNFLHGIPLFAISIGLVKDGVPIAGVVLNPIADELFVAERGKGAFVNERRLRVAARRELADTVIGCGLPHRGGRVDLDLFRKELAAVQPQVAGLRRTGAAALDMAWVAAGRFDGYWERGLSPWDLAAGLVLVREAGGFATDLDGGDAVLGKGSIVAGNEMIHRALLAALTTA